MLERFSEQPRKLGDLADEYFATVMFDETFAQRDGTIRRETCFPTDVSEWILQGPHFYVGTPFNKTPNEGCSTNRDYRAIDLAAISDDYLPRTNYVPDCDPAEYAGRIPKWNGKPVTEFYRYANRRQVSPTGERTLVPSVIPVGASHVDGVFSVASHTSLVVDLGCVASSLPLDFFVKTTGKGDCRGDLLSKLPVPSDLPDVLRLRFVQLCCLTVAYSDLWASTLARIEHGADFAQSDRRLRRVLPLRPTWDRDCGLRTNLERRQALVEIDVLTSMTLKLRVEELLTMFRVQFPVLQQYEREQLYDQQGRIVPTSKTAAGKPTVSLVEVAATLKEQAGFDVHAEYHPDGSNTQELRKQKMRLGKKEADVLGISERCTMADLLAETEVRWSDEDHPEGRPVRLVGLRYTDPGLEPRMERVYPTPWTRCDREADYRQAWAEFERRLGKKMPEGTRL